jgi:hypothetical protein
MRPTMLRDQRCRADRLSRLLPLAFAWFTVILTTGTAHAFDSGSTGADGALDFTGSPPGTVIEFDPTTFTPPLDPEGDSIYHFTSITIPADVTVKLRADKAGSAPIFWLATQAVVIDGTLDSSGEKGHDASAAAPRTVSIPGPGGFGGGIGGLPPTIDPQDGFGPGAELTNIGFGDAGHATAGCGICTNTYGNAFLLPLIGGSGGRGERNTGSGGGAGGGAILIASSVSIRVNGQVLVDGGRHGDWTSGESRGGSGSGGAIRLVAPSFDGNGTISAKGLSLSLGKGRVRIETTQNTFTGTLKGDVRSTTLLPGFCCRPRWSQPYAS